MVKCKHETLHTIWDQEIALIQRKKLNCDCFFSDMHNAYTMSQKTFKRLVRGIRRVSEES